MLSSTWSLHNVLLLLGMQERPGAKDFVEAQIIVDKERLRGILLGRQGSAIKALATASRLEIEEFLQVGSCWPAVCHRASDVMLAASMPPGSPMGQLNASTPTAAFRLQCGFMTALLYPHCLSSLLTCTDVPR